MGLPRSLKKMAMFHGNQTWIGEVNEVTLPKLTRKTADWRGGGMPAGVPIDLGMDNIGEISFTAGGPMQKAISAFGGSLTGQLIRFVGYYQADDTQLADVVEVTVRGRYSEIDFGSQKVGDNVGAFKGTIKCSYLKIVWNGSKLIEIDPLNMVEIVDGINIGSTALKALGLAF
ncbi:phage major tail tube protein [Zymomonas mobilis]|uniref:phage major tail tube protein n=1 Tax=Zymomonas mobilis TaxID=542 RepID=UPI0039E79256